jgi:hypothetical protein
MSLALGALELLYMQPGMNTGKACRAAQKSWRRSVHGRARLIFHVCAGGPGQGELYFFVHQQGKKEVIFYKVFCEVTDTERKYKLLEKAKENRRNTYSSSSIF